MKGGARARSGPAPDPNALRREKDSGDWITLPEEGRQGPAPEWPLADQLDREAVLWEQEWTRPQAVMWERYGQELEVALYVRSVIAAEQHDAPTNARTLVKQLQEALGLSVPGLLRNHWRIEGGSDEGVAEPIPIASARERFEVVAGGMG